MSVKVMGWIWDQKLEPTQKSVLLALGDHADHDGNNIYPGVARLAEKTGYSERSVQRTLKILLKDEWIIATKNTMGGRGKTTIYSINWKKGDSLSPFTESERVTTGPERVTPVALKGDTGGSPLNRTVLNHQEPCASTALPEPEKNQPPLKIKIVAPEAYVYKYFSKRCLEHRGFLPQFKGDVDSIPIRRCLERLSLEDIEKLIDWFFTSFLTSAAAQNKRFSPSINLCFSPGVVNQWQDIKNSGTVGKSMDAAGRILKDLP